MRSVAVRLAKLEQRISPQRQTGVVTRLYTSTDPSAQWDVRVLQVRFTGDPPFSEADTHAMDARVHEKYGSHFIGAFV